MRMQLEWWGTGMRASAIISQEPAAFTVASPEASSHGKGATRQLSEWYGSWPHLLPHAIW